MRNPDHLYKQTITLYSSTVDGYGKKAYSNPIEHLGRFTNKSMLIKDEKGEDIQADAIVHLKGSVTVNISDRLDYDSNSYEVKKLQTTPDRNGNIRFIKIIVKKIST